MKIVNVNAVGGYVIAELDGLTMTMAAVGTACPYPR
jgi:hypothetical protein